MFKRKYIVLLVFLMILIICSTGVATWTIVKDQPLTNNPTYDSDTILGNEDYVDVYYDKYDGKNHIPHISSDIIDVVDLYYREKGSSSSYILVNDDLKNAPVNAGEYDFKIVPENVSIDDVTERHLVTIEKVLVKVSALSASLTYGEELNKENVDIEFVFDGFVNGEIEEDVVDFTNLTYTSSTYHTKAHSTLNDNVDKYVITPSGLEATNYEFEYENVNLDVLRKIVSINWNDANSDLIYNTTSQNPIANVVGIINNDQYELTYSGSNTNANKNSLGLLPGKHVYTASVTGISNGEYTDYVIDSANNPSFDYYINQYKLNVTANSVEITFGDDLTNDGYIMDEYFDTDTVDTSTIDYDYTYTRYGDVGSYKITPKGLSHDNYEFVYASNTFKVNQKVVGINWTSGPFEYNGASHTITPTINQNDLVIRHDTNEIIDCTITETKLNGELVNLSAINAGSYSVNIISISNDNYVVSVTDKLETFTINPRDISNATFNFDSAIYNGSELKPNITFNDLYDGNNILTSSDFTSVFGNNVHATMHISVTEDKARCTITGTKNYSGTVTKYFDITPATLSDDDFIWGESVFEYKYNTKQHPIVTKVNGVISSDVINVTSYSSGQIQANYSSNGEVKTGETYTVYVLNIDNTDYKFESGSIKFMDYKIKKVVAEPAAKKDSNSETSLYNLRSLSADFSYVYNGLSQVPYFYLTNLQYGDTCEITPFGAEVNVNTNSVYTAYITQESLDNKNYELDNTYSKTFIITPKDITLDEISVSVPNVEFTGSALTPTVTVVDNGLLSNNTLTQNKDYTVTYNGDHTNVGTVTVTITGIGNYENSRTTTFEITPKSINGASVSISSPVYTGSALTPDVTIIVDGETLVKGTDFTVNCTNNINAGSANIIITGKGNYSGEIEKTFTITKRNIEEVEAQIETLVYTGTALTPNVTITNSHATLSSSDYSYEYYDNTNAGNSAYILINATDSGNYTGSKKVYFTISKATFDMSSVRFDDKTFGYDGLPHSIEITGTLPLGVSVSYEGNNVSTLGTHTVIAKFSHSNPNYKDIPNMTATITISQTSLSGATIKFKDDISSFVYTTSEIVPEIIVTLDGNTLVQGTDFDVDIQNNINVGTATITLIGKGNYSGSTSTTFTITPATINMDGVVFNDKVVDYSGNNEAFIATNVPTGVTVSYNIVDAVNAGTYDIVAKFTAPSDNYVLSLDTLSAKLTINKILPTINVENVTTTYDGEYHSVEATTNSNGLITYENNSHMNKGVYTATIKVAEGTNYLAHSTTATITINARNVTITVNNATSPYGSSFVTNGYVVTTNNILDKDLALFNFDVVIDNAVINETTPVGTYTNAINLTYTENDNYVINVVKGTYSITAGSIDTSHITFSNTTVTYNGKHGQPGTSQMFIIDNLPTGVKASFKYMEAEFTGAITAGEYQVKVIYTPIDENYTLTKEEETVTFTIEKAQIERKEPTTTSFTKVYDGEAYNKINGFLLDVDFNYNETYDYSTNDITSVGSFTITISVAESANYKAYSEAFDITITKATPTVENVKVIYNEKPTFTSYFTTNMNVNEIMYEFTSDVPGTISYSDTKDKLVVGKYQYAYTFTPTDTHNYNIVTGTTEIETFAMISYCITYNGEHEYYTITMPSGHTIDGAYNPTKEGHTLDGWYKDSGLTNKWNMATEILTDDLELFAKWDINQYTIIFKDGETNISELTQDYGTAITAPSAPTKTGYTFIGWDMNGDKVADEVPTTMPAGNMIFVAIWEIQKHTITFVLNNGLDNIVISEDYGTVITAPADPTKTGHTFGGWDKAIPATMPAEDMIITAKWIINQYTITFDTDGGTTIAPITQDYGTAITAPSAPTKTGHTFDGWDKAIPATMPAEDITITAKWKVNQYTITFDTDGGTDIAPITQDYGTTITAPVDPTKNGYTFDGWDIEIPATMPAENITITANWTINQYTITFNTDGGTAIDAITQDYGTAVTAPSDPTKTGYTFAGWDKEIPATMPAENMTITATWTINKYTITFNTDGGTAIDVIIQDYGTAVTAPSAPTKTGYTFAGWDQEIPATMPAENITITANWTINQYTITFDTDGGSVITPITQNYGTAITAPTDPTKTGYTFAGWDKAIPTTMPAEDMTIKATWTINQYTITFDTDGGSTIAPISQNYGTDITAPTYPTKTGYTFVGWDREIPTTMPAENITITAIWSVDTHKITLVFGHGIANKVISLPYGTEIPAQSAPEIAGYKFVKWDIEIPATMPAEDVVITAEWSLIVYNITYDLNNGIVGGENPLTYTIESGNITLINPTRTGYTFAGWVGTDLDDATIEVSIITGSIGDRTYTATWTPITYSISYDLVGGSVATDNPTSYTIESGNITLINPIRTGYTFAGWVGTDLDDATIEVSIITGSIGNRTYTATWTPITYSISYDLAGGSVATDNPTIYTIESGDITLINPIRTGYTFAGWEGTDIEGTSMTVIISEGSIGGRTYTATWTIDSHTITIVYGHGIADKVISLPYGTTVPVQVAPEVDGYEFVKWDREIPATMPAEDVVITAVWNLIVYNISYVLNNGIVDGENPTTYTVESNTFILINPTRTGYTFAGWVLTGVDGTIENVTIEKGSIGNRTYTAIWTPITYTISYNLNGGSINGVNPTSYTIESESITLINPTRTGYTFAGWVLTGVEGTFENVTIEKGSIGNRTYTATWNINRYTVTWKNHNGDVLEVDENVPYGTIPAYNSATPTKDRTDQFSYAFTGWSPAISAVTDDITYTAVFEESTNSYTVTFKDFDGTVLKEQIVPYGTGATAPDEPSRPATDEFTYTFTGWDKDFTNITGNLTVNALYDSTVNVYTVTFNSNGGSSVASKDVAYGDKVTKPTDPTLTGYDFGGWYLNGALYDFDSTITGNITLVAEWNIKQFTITFIDGETVLYTITQDYGTAINAPADPTKTGYTFDGWDTIIPETMPAYDITINATWNINTYTVIFVDYNNEIISTETVEHGGCAIAPTNVTTKEGYDHTGWDKSFDNVTTNLTVKAIYSIKTFEVKFYDWNNNQIGDTQTVNWNEAAEAPIAPTREGYDFTGWDQKFTNVTTNLSVKAIYAIKTFEVKFYDWNNNQIGETQIVNWNEAAVAPAAPTREGYNFIGWDQEFSNVTAHLTVTAKYEINKFTVTFIDWDGTTINTQTIEYGKAATEPADPTREGYTFTGWDNEFSNVTKNIIVTAKYTINQYTITFNTNGGSAISAITQDYGSAITVPANPTKIGYTFAGWNKEIPTTMPAENITITASWTINQYTITFNTNGGSDISAITQDYGTAITAPAAPTKTGYTFAGWDKDIPTTMPAENITITASWSVNKYTLTIYKPDGTVLSTEEVEFNTTITKPADPTKESTVSEVFTFIGWDINNNGTVDPVPTNMPANDLVLKPVFETSVRKYTITFNSNGGSSVEEIEVAYGTKVLRPTDPTQIGYEFGGWYLDGVLYDFESTITGDIILVAEWNIKQFTITFMDGEIVLYTITQDYGTAVTAPADPTKTGYTFKDWDIVIPSIMPAEDIIINATWRIIPVITYNDNSNKFTYNGKPHEAVFTINPSSASFEVTYYLDEKLTYEYNGTPTNAGTYYAVVNVSQTDDIEGKLFIDQIIQINIERLDIAFANAVIYEKKYNGEPVVLTKEEILININSITLTNNDFNIIGYENNDGVGTAKVIIEGIGNFTGEKIFEFDIISKISLSETDVVYDSIVTFNGKDQTPTIIIKYGDLTLIEGTDYTLSYYDSTDNVVTEMIYKDTYKIIVNADEIVYTGTLELSFDIQKVRVKPIIGEVNYDPSANTWSTFKIDAVQYIQFENIENSDEKLYFNSSLIEIIGMHDGTYKYGTIGIDNLDDTQSFIIGSTYYASIDTTFIGVQNIELANENKNVIIKYKTVLIENVDDMFTIEDALLNNNYASNTIRTVGNLTNYVITTFTNLGSYGYSEYENSTFFINGRKLLISFEDSYTDYKLEGGSGSGKVYSALIIPENVSITFENNAQLVLGGHMASQMPKISVTTNRGVIMNSGKLYFKTNSTLYSYGYLKGTETGLVHLYSSTMAMDPLFLMDWMGGTAASSLYFKSTFPGKAWSIHNISCSTRIDYGAKYQGFAYVVATGVKDPTYFYLISGDTKDSSMFYLKNGYILKETYPAGNSNTDSYFNELYTITGLNQIAGQKDKIIMNGDFEDGQLKIKMYIDIKTSQELAAPVSFMDVVIKSGVTGTLGTSSYYFMPGTSVLVEEGATCTIKEGSNVLFVSSSYKDSLSFTTNINNVDSYLEVNGNLIVKGALGGLVKTSGSTGKIEFASGNTIKPTCKIFVSGSNAQEVSINANGYISPNNTISDFSSGKIYEAANSIWTTSGDSGESGGGNEGGGGSCFVTGTQITMADGTMKNVEDLVYGDKVLVFNHETGKLEVSVIIFNAHLNEPEMIRDILNLQFSNGNTLRIAVHHGLFDVTLNKYVDISYDNVSDYIGHKFYYVSFVEGEFISEEVVLTGYEVTQEVVKVYSPITANQINCFGEGMLTAPGLYNNLMNIFELDGNMKIDEIKKQEDIEKYGLYEYAVFEEYVSYEIYLVFGGQYYKVAVEKGLITLDEIIEIILDFNIKDSTGIK